MAGPPPVEQTLYQSALVILLLSVSGSLGQKDCTGVDCPDLSNCIEEHLEAEACCTTCVQTGCTCEGYQYYDCVHAGFKNGHVPEGQSYFVDFGSTECSCPEGGGRIGCHFMPCPDVPANCIEVSEPADGCVTCERVGCVHDNQKYEAGHFFHLVACEACHCPSDGGQLMCYPVPDCDPSNPGDPHKPMLATIQEDRHTKPPYNTQETQAIGVPLYNRPPYPFNGPKRPPSNSPHVLPFPFDAPIPSHHLPLFKPDHMTEDRDYDYLTTDASEPPVKDLAFPTPSSSLISVSYPGTRETQPRHDRGNSKSYDKPNDWADNGYGSEGYDSRDKHELREIYGVCCSCCVLGLALHAEGRGCDAHQYLGDPCGHVLLTCCEEEGLSPNPNKTQRKKEMPRPTALIPQAELSFLPLSLALSSLLSLFLSLTPSLSHSTLSRSLISPLSLSISHSLTVSFHPLSLSHLSSLSISHFLTVSSPPSLSFPNSHLSSLSFYLSLPHCLFSSLYLALPSLHLSLPHCLFPPSLSSLTSSLSLLLPLPLSPILSLSLPLSLSLSPILSLSLTLSLSLSHTLSVPHPLSLSLYPLTDVNECVTSTHSCQASERCVNTVGSFVCERTVTCPAGYQLRNEVCEDIDECMVRSHNCGQRFECENTEGSFLCNPKQRCLPGFTQDSHGNCIDINECSSLSDPCSAGFHCINTVGSYTCQRKVIMCSQGYHSSPDGTRCIDVDECQTGNHGCGEGQICHNLPGSYRCDCQTGYLYDSLRQVCSDVNECWSYPGRLCAQTCENSPGSYQCSCTAGFSLAFDGKNCEDLNECDSSPCGQECANIYGSYQCYCRQGFYLKEDGHTCEDIDECSQSIGNLCVFQCVNVPGSYQCACPPNGYTMSTTGHTCRDIDECTTGGHNCSTEQTCSNVQGGFRCLSFSCPPYYRKVSDTRCERSGCPANSVDCQTSPLRITYYQLSFQTNIVIPAQIFRIGPSPAYRGDNIAISITHGNEENYFSTRKLNSFTGAVYLQRQVRQPRDFLIDVEMKLLRQGAFTTFLARIYVFITSNTL
uniref:Fibulin-2-like n=1 Tax=Salmo trutta TaxID=8032 RepID=A0A674CD59_SALTR